MNILLPYNLLFQERSVNLLLEIVCNMTSSILPYCSNSILFHHLVLLVLLSDNAETTHDLQKEYE